MTKALRFLVALLVAVPLFAQAQQRTYSQPELDQILAPVALYPDALLSQVLMAATYPDEVREAADWSRAYPGIQGDDAVRAVEHRNWDPSVKSLVAFPQVLQRMAENPQWMQSLGEAFVAQEPHVMDTVQQLRHRAQAAGNLQSNEQLQVQQQGPAILIEPASPQYVYVPYYDPLVVYGPWWWPAYRPVYWAPWRPYVVRLSTGFFFGNFDWHHRHARVVHPHAYYYRSAALANRSLAASPQRWRPDTQRRAHFSARRGEQVRQQIQVQPQQRQQVRTQQTAVPALQIQPAVQAQPGVQPRPRVQRDERRVERREARQAARVQAPAAVQPQVRMPAAVAPPQPRAERIEQRQERREMRQEQRRERATKG